MDNFRLCRICISQSESPVMMSIFGEDALWKKIISFANVHIEEGDSLPQQICIICAKNAINACSFKQKCEEADSFFRKQMLKKMELRLPDDTEIISISSGSVDMMNGGRIEKETDDYCLSLAQNNYQDNFPILMEDSIGTNGDQWDTGHRSSIDDKFDHLPLIPEIELITPNDDDSRNDGEEFNCHVCFKCFSNKLTLKHHVRNCHPETNPTYECFECKKTYLSKRFLEKHIRMGRCVKKRKNTTRPMQCSECRTLFPTGHHLGWHKRTGSCRSRSPKLSLIEYEQRNESETNEEQEGGGFNGKSTGRQRRKKFGKLRSRGGRTRIKLDAKKIAYATELVKQEVSTTKFAQELKISRTFAWRLRKTIENNMYKEAKQQEEEQELQRKNAATKKLSMNEETFTKELEIDNIHPSEIEKEAGKYCNREKNKSFIEKIPDKSVLQRLNGPCPKISETQTMQNIETNKIIYTNENAVDIKKEAVVNVHKTQKSFEIKEELTLPPNKQEEESNEDESDGDDEESTDETQTSEENHFENESSQPSCSDAFNDSSYTRTRRQESQQDSTHQKKPRKPNVFIDDEKYAKAKILVANNASTMEIAKQLDVSQMSAWKLRDCILKNIPLTFKKPTTPRPPVENKPKIKVPRRRLRRDERVQRDKIVTKEILSMIKEDSNIQYWKVSERLAEKGFPLSPSSVCQRLKSMGIHRRLRPTDRNPYHSDLSKGDSSADEDNQQH